MQPFKIDISQSVLDDLQGRLEKIRWTDEPKNADWNYGTNPMYLKELITYWQNTYDWRKQETELNKLSQFTVQIEGTLIHFVHVKGEHQNSKPLLLTHGWPDSFYRFYKVIPMLTSGEDSFDVVVPSIPGFGFSDKLAMNTDQIAGLFGKLMKDILGYFSCFAAGGDLGAIVTKSLANQFPNLVKAIHLTDVGYPTGKEDWSKMSEEEREYGQFIQQWMMREGAYNMIQSTKPQTLGYGLNDSPVGLASWILEKFNTWSDNQGNIENTFTKDELLTNIMIYWVTQTINSSIRTYYQEAKAANSVEGLQSGQKVKSPTGVALFPGEAQFPKEWANRMANVERYTKMAKGGHFAAMEQPELWAEEIKSFFREY